MSSRFVSAGGAEVKAPEGLSSTTDDAWAKAREQVEKAKQPAKNEPAPGTQEGGKSLYEHLQDQKGQCGLLCLMTCIWTNRMCRSR